MQKEFQLKRAAGDRYQRGIIIRMLLDVSSVEIRDDNDDDVDDDEDDTPICSLVVYQYFLRIFLLPRLVKWK